MSIEQALLAPVFLHVLLTFVVGAFTLQARIEAVRKGKARLKEIALNTNAWPEKSLKLGNNLNNQFQVPVIWYACCALLLVTGKADWVAVALSWAFIVTRILHSLEHSGRNVIMRRMPLFLAGYACVIAMWAWLAFRLYVAG